MVVRPSISMNVPLSCCARRQLTMPHHPSPRLNSLIKFNKFLQENESKRNRAVKRTQDERKQREQKESEIVRLKEEHRKRLVRRRVHRAHSRRRHRHPPNSTQPNPTQPSTTPPGEQEDEKTKKRELQLNEKYQLYLTNVVEGGGDDYHEIQDLLNRYKTLKDANQDLADAQRKHEQDNEDKRLEFANFKKERQNEMLNQNNDIAKLQKILEGREGITLRLLNDVDSTIRGTSDKTLELGQILRSVQNLLERFQKQVHSNAKHSSDQPRRAEKATSGGKSAEEIESDGKQAVESLDEICMYVGAGPGGAGRGGAGCVALGRGRRTMEVFCCVGCIVVVVVVVGARARAGCGSGGWHAPLVTCLRSHHPALPFPTYVLAGICWTTATS